VVHLQTLVFALAPIAEFPWSNDRIMHALGRLLAALSLTAWQDSLLTDQHAAAVVIFITAVIWMVAVVAGTLTVIWQATKDITSHDMRVKVGVWRCTCCRQVCWHGVFTFKFL
jgi:hypothetical protein